MSDHLDGALACWSAGLDDVDAVDRPRFRDWVFDLADDPDVGDSLAMPVV